MSPKKLLLLPLLLLSALSAQAAVPPEGKVIFTELNIWPSDSSYAEWVELTSLEQPGGAAYDLNGCELRTASCDGFDDAGCLGLDVGSMSSKAKLSLVGGASSIVVPAAGPVVLMGSTTKPCAGYDAVGVCTPATQPAATYSSSSVGFTATTRKTVVLACPDGQGTLYAVDRMIYYWPDAKAVCGAEGSRCTYELANNAMDPLQNNDVNLWSAAPDTAPYTISYSGETPVVGFGTPGAPNAHVYRAIIAPDPGSVIFNELNIWPSSSPVEWLELSVLEPYSDELNYNLKGCVLRQADCTGLTDAQCLLATPDAKQATLGALDLEVGSFPVLGNSSNCLAYSLDDLNGDGTLNDCLRKADLTYSSSYLSLPTTSKRMLELACMDPTGTYYAVDQVVYDWSQESMRCTEPSGHCSLELSNDPLNQDALSNDARRYWDPSPGPVFVGAVGTSVIFSYGSPGEANQYVYVPYYHLEAGDVVFSELAVWPGSDEDGPEWLELYVANVPEVAPLGDLNGCKLRTYNCGDLNEADCLAAQPSSWTDETWLLPTLGELPLVKGDRLVLSSDDPTSCVTWGTPEEPLVDNSGVPLCLEGDITYQSFTMSNSDLRLLELACPDLDENLQTVDRVLFDQGMFDDTCQASGGQCSWEARPQVFAAVDDGDTEALAPGVANDDFFYWGSAVSSAAYLATVIDPLTGVAYGTPWEGPSIPDLSVVAQGSLVISEISAWASTGDSSPDWLEVKVTAPPEGASVYDLAQCALRSFTCPEEGTVADCVAEVTSDGFDEWKNGPLKPLAADLWVKAEDDPYLVFASNAARALISQDPEVVARGSYSSSVGFSSSGLRVVELTCPSRSGEVTVVDRMAFDADAVSWSCTHTDLRCSMALRPGSEEAEANDALSAWVPSVESYLEPAAVVVEDTGRAPAEGARAFGSPGAMSQVPPLGEAADAPGAGEVVIAELMVDPVNYAPEWIELQGAAGLEAPRELAGCMLIKEPSDLLTGEGSSSRCTPDSLGACQYFVLPDSSRMRLPIGASSAPRRLLVSGGACLSTDGVPWAENLSGACSLPADLAYEGLNFSADEPEGLSLWCRDDQDAWILVDELRYNWDTVSDQCPYSAELGSCSLAVHQDHVTSDANDDSYFRCVSQPEKGVYIDEKGIVGAASPGGINGCEEIIPPFGVGEAVISEMMISPKDLESPGAFANEWFELVSLVDSERSVRSCRLVVKKYEEGVLDETSADADDLGDTEVGSVAGGGTVLWVRDGCMFGVEVEEDPTQNTCLNPQSEEDTFDIRPYSGIEFTSSSWIQFSFECQGEGGSLWTVDAVTVNANEYGIASAHSWQLETASTDSILNDDPFSWCVGPCTAEFTSSLIAGTVEKHYGTPGWANNCPAPVNPGGGEGGPGCRCDSGSGRALPGELGWALLMAGAFWMRRRRSA